MRPEVTKRAQLIPFGYYGIYVNASGKFSRARDCSNIDLEYRARSRSIYRLIVIRERYRNRRERSGDGHLPGRHAERSRNLAIASPCLTTDFTFTHLVSRNQVSYLSFIPLIGIPHVRLS